MAVGTRPKKASPTVLDGSWLVCGRFSANVGDDVASGEEEDSMMVENIVIELRVAAGVVVVAVTVVVRSGDDDACDVVGTAGGGAMVLEGNGVVTTRGLEAVVGSCVMKDGFCLSMMSSSSLASTTVPKRAMTATSTASHEKRPRGKGMVNVSLANSHSSMAGRHSSSFLLVYERNSTSGGDVHVSNRKRKKNHGENASFLFARPAAVAVHPVEH